MGPPRPEETFQNQLHIGSLGSGKSHIQRFMEITLSCFIQDNYGIIVRKRWEELKNHVIDDLFRLADEITEGNRTALLSDPKRVGASFEITVFTTGKPSRIIVKPEPDGTDEQITDHFKGPEYGWFSLEEATQLREITFDTLCGRLRRVFPTMKPEHCAFMWSGMAVTNPPYVGHWISKRADESEALLAKEELTRLDTLIIRSQMTDNPFLRPEYIDTQNRGQQGLA